VDRAGLLKNCFKIWAVAGYDLKLPVIVVPVLEISSIPSWLHWLPSCPSTNSWAIARPSLKDGDVVFTPRQTAGRGQHGRVWQSPPGVLTASFVLDHLQRQRMPALSVVAGLAVIYAVEDLTPVRCLAWKWPNDVYAQGRKLAGILCEAAASSRVIIGIGLNLEATPIADRAISLQQLSQRVPQPLDLLDRLRHYLRQAASFGDYASLLTQLHDRDFLYGRWLTLQTGTSTVVGHGAGVDNQGRLLVRLKNGIVQTFSAGRVVHWE